MIKFDGGDDPTKGCFKTLENKIPNDCITFDDTTEAEAVIDACVAQLVAAIDPPPLTQAKCGAGKTKCVSNKLKSILKCYQTAQTPGKNMDPNDKDCIVKARTKFDGGIATPEKGCFEKLENKTKSDCQGPLNNTAELEDLVDDCVDQLVVFLETP